MPGGFPNIASSAAWTGEFVDNPAFEHFLSWWFQRRKDCFKLSKRHDDVTRGTSFVESTGVALCDFTTVLDFEGRFLCLGR